jgi:hypothetical protein
MGGQYENDAVIMADVAVLVRAFVDTQQRGKAVDLVGFEALLEYHGDRSHYAVSTLTPERRSLFVQALESFNVGAGKPRPIPCRISELGNRSDRLWVRARDRSGR